MTDFKREERYIVIKLKDLDDDQLDELRGNLIGIRARECVVVEPHHPHYEETWENVQRWAEGRPSIGEERDALAAHVERLIRGGRYLHHELQQWSLTERDPETSAAMSTWDVIVRESPATSLARRDADKQTEAMESLLNEARNSYGAETVRAFIRNRLNRLHRQAQEAVQ